MVVESDTPEVLVGVIFVIIFPIEDNPIILKAPGKIAPAAFATPSTTAPAAGKTLAASPSPVAHNAVFPKREKSFFETDSEIVWLTPSLTEEEVPRVSDDDVPCEIPSVMLIDFNDSACPFISRHW